MYLVPNEILFGVILIGKVKLQLQYSLTNKIQNRFRTDSEHLHTEESFGNIFKSNRNQIVTKCFRLEPNGRSFGFKSIGKW